MISNIFVAIFSIPQGSTLGYLWFVISISDTGNDVKSKLIKFTDDVKLYCSVNRFSDYLVLQQDINKIYKWSVDKSVIMTYVRKMLLIKYHY